MWGPLGNKAPEDSMIGGAGSSQKTRSLEPLFTELSLWGNSTAVLCALGSVTITITPSQMGLSGGPCEICPLSLPNSSIPAGLGQPHSAAAAPEAP